MIQFRASRRTKKLLIGAAAFGGGFPLFAVLHNVFYALAGMTDIGIVGAGLTFLSVASFLIAVFLCPAGVVFCLIAALLDALTGGRTTWPRLFAVIVVSAVAAVAGVVIFGELMSPSTIERDDEAGYNGSFEVVKAELPVNWHVYDRALDDGDAEIVYDTEDPVDGIQSLGLIVHRADPRGGWGSPGLFQDVEAVAGRSYRVSFWLKNRDCRVRLLIDSEKGESHEPRNPIVEIIGPERTGDDVWQRFEYTYTVPENYANIRFEINVLAAGRLWIDDVRIEPLAGG